ncbi:MAG: hypothetical protein OEV66_09445 [Spirochaetia bacterium]|nr:hypothetical protein [Spirochaetia bacterium]
MFINPADSIMQSIQSAHDMLVRLTEHNNDASESPDPEIIHHDKPENPASGQVDLVA